MQYLDLLDRIQRHLRPRTYVEIGVRFGTSLQLALPGTTTVGIDPAADLRYPTPRRTRVFEQPSDEFFAEHDLAAVLGGPVDLAFIDGMHLFEFALRDFVNLERAATPQSAILVHDCYPIDARSAARDRSTKLWSGDVWKLILLLRTHRPDLSVATVDAAPTGLGIVTGLDPTSTVLGDALDDILAEYRDLDYAAIEDDKAARLNRVPPDWPVVERLLPAPYRQANPSLLRAGRALRMPTTQQIRSRFARSRALSPA
jgi:hypothetical protein